MRWEQTSTAMPIWPRAILAKRLLTTHLAPEHVAHAQLRVATLAPLKRVALAFVACHNAQYARLVHQLHHRRRNNRYGALQTRRVARYACLWTSASIGHINSAWGHLHAPRAVPRSLQPAETPEDLHKGYGLLGPCPLLHLQESTRKTLPRLQDRHLWLNNVACVIFSLCQGSLHKLLCSCARLEISRDSLWDR